MVDKEVLHHPDKKQIFFRVYDKKIWKIFLYQEH